MSKIYIMPNGMRKELNSMTQIQRELDSIEQSVYLVAVNLHIQGTSGIKLRNAILNKKKKIHESRKDIDRLKHTGNEIVQKYVTTENAIVDPEIKENAEPVNGDTAKPKWSDLLLDGALEFIGEGGVIGGVVSGTVKYIKGDKKTSKTLDYVKTYVDATHDILDGVSSKDSWKQILFGLGKCKDASEGNFFARWKDALSKEVAEYGFKKGATVLDKAATVAKWGGTILTVAGKASDNYEEFKDQGGLQNKRFWEETALESAIDIGLGMAISAAVGPGIVAAGVSAVALWGVDEAFKKFTGKSFTESASDFIIDSVGSLGKKAGKAFSKWKSCFGW